MDPFEPMEAAPLAPFDVAQFVVLAPRGPDKTAQGNALGTRKTAKNEGKSPEGAQHGSGIAWTNSTIA
jgi:hypothetical protein